MSDYVDIVCEHIPGFTSPEFLRELRKMAYGKNLIIEIGAFKGRSSAVLAQACHGMLYSIDIWDNNTYSPNTFDAEDGFYKSEDNCLAYHLWLSHMTRMGLSHRVIPMIGNSHWLERYFKPNSVDMVFVDGDHAEHMVLIDIRLYLPKLVEDGIMCGDDYDMPSVQRPVDAMAVMNGFRVETFDNGKGWRYTK